MKKLIKTIVKSIVRRVVTKNAVLDVESGRTFYPYRWELFRRFSFKTGYTPVEEYQDEQSEYLEIV